MVDTDKQINYSDRSVKGLIWEEKPFLLSRRTAKSSQCRKMKREPHFDGCVGIWTKKERGRLSRQTEGTLSMYKVLKF